MARRRSAKSSKGKRSAGGGAGWKKSKGFAVALVVVIIGLWISMIKSTCWPSRKPTFENFPYQYMTEKSHKLIEKRADSDKQPQTPWMDDETGELVWEAYVCTNPNCPWLRSKDNPDHKPYIFPMVSEYRRKVFNGEIDPEAPMEEGSEMPEEYYMEEMQECPICKKAKIDAFSVERYNTAEGKEMHKKLREKYAKEKNNN